MKLKYLCVGLLFFCFSMQAQITVLSPGTEEQVKSADDYATLIFQDPWDMDKRTDLGWFIYNVVDNPHSNLREISFTGGIFSAQSTTVDPNIFILDTGIPGSAFLGKIGSNYPIDANRFRVLAVRMKLDSASSGQVFWSTDTIYSGVSTSNAFATRPGWNIYMIDLSVLGTAAGSSWQGMVDSLRLDPTVKSDEQIEIDWIRLVESQPEFFRVVAWQGNSGNVDIYLDSDTDFHNGFAGMVARNVSGSSYSINAGSLAPGIYYVGVCESGDTSTIAYSAGYFSVNDIPTVRFTAPGPAGSPDDFATVQLNNPWDMDSLQDVDHYNNLSNVSFINVDGEDDQGNPRNNVSVLKAANIQDKRDPLVYTLWWGDRGYNYRIDPERYRILDLQMGLTGHRDILNGSIARIVWRVHGETLENVSQDIILRHKAGNLVLNRIIADMKNIPVESGENMSGTGWNGLLDGFRVDPHEFLDSREFYVAGMKITAFERADDSYDISWECSDSTPGSLTISLYRDTDNSGYNGTEIVTGLDPEAGTYHWNTSALPEGEYYIYAVISDSVNENRAYAKWPLVIDHAFNPTLPQIFLSRDTLNYGVTCSGEIFTGDQKVLVQVENSENIGWTVTSNRDFILLDKLGGTGNGEFSVSLKKQNYTPGSYDGTITLSSAQADNSPRYVRVFFEVYDNGCSVVPFGVFSTPVNGSTVRGSVPVTGWVLDDIEVKSVKIYRETVEDPVYIGDAVFVEGARPDVETLYPNYPLNYRAGWGYMLLTYGLPDKGMNSTCSLRAIAFDKEGNSFDLGTKSIHCDNQNAVKPFGAIDRPFQGGEASGSYINWGWALTPNPNIIPVDGSTINVVVDGVILGNPVYNNYREDIATRYAGYANSDGAVGYFSLDTSAYANGIHTISWRVTDSAGNQEGIGSRFFNIVNSSTSGGSGSSGTAVGGNFREIMALTADSGPVRVKRENEDGAEIFPRSGEDFVELVMPEVSLLEVKICPENPDYVCGGGYLQVGKQLRALPAGTTLDREKGIFYWQPGPGFVGAYDFVFVDPRRQIRKNMRVIIEPQNDI